MLEQLGQARGARSVQLQEIDGLSAQVAQALLHGLVYMDWIGEWAGMRIFIVDGGITPDFGGQVDRITDAAQSCAQGGFGAVTGSGVDEVDAQIHRLLDKAFDQGVAAVGLAQPGWAT